MNGYSAVITWKSKGILIGFGLEDLRKKRWKLIILFYKKE